MTTGGWEIKRLGDCCVGKPQYGANAPAIQYCVSLPRYVRITDIDDSGNLVKDPKVSIPLDGNEKHLLREGDFLFARSGATVGKTYLYREEDGLAVFAGYLIRFRLDPSVLLPEYLKYYTQTHRYDYWVKSTLRAGAQPNINAQEYSSLQISVPALTKQRKIVDILRTWDKAIALTEQLIEAKQRRKRALMQQLLTGRRRFEQFVRSSTRRQTRFTDLPTDWGYVQISDIAQEVSARNQDGRDYPVLSCTKHYGLVDSLEYFGRQIFSDDTSSYKVVKRGQFAYATNHIEEGSIGYQDLHDVALISPMYTVFETDDQVDDHFLYKVLKTELYRHIFEINTNGTVNRRGSLRWKEFSQIRIPLPSLEEQRAIAEVLQCAEKEIELLEEKRDALQRQKKGLMQQLLTGRMRVKA